jgi:hypothetical protein
MEKIEKKFYFSAKNGIARKSSFRLLFYQKFGAKPGVGVFHPTAQFAEEMFYGVFWRKR